MTSRVLATVVLLIGSNIFMTWAWYGHLKKAAWAIPTAIFFSWMIALPEYILQVPANRIGHVSQGGPFTAPQLKIIQEAITLTVFIVFSILVLKERPRTTDYIAFGLILAAVLVAMIGRWSSLASEQGAVVVASVVEAVTEADGVAVATATEGAVVVMPGEAGLLDGGGGGFSADGAGGVGGVGGDRDGGSGG